MADSLADQTTESGLVEFDGEAKACEFARKFLDGKRAKLPNSQALGNLEITRDDVLFIKPGRELDALVAEMLGWNEIKIDAHQVTSNGFGIGVKPNEERT